MTATTQQALKEWQVAVEALAAGEMVVLLRKGGIREQGGQFALAHKQVVLLPTVAHQKPELLKPKYAAQVMVVPTDWHPATLYLPAWAEITHSWPITDCDRAQQLAPFHIWNDTFVRERLAWKPQQPLQALLLRVYRFAAPIALPYDPAYGGCRSWVEIPLATPLTRENPAIATADYHQHATQIEHILTAC